MKTTAQSERHVTGSGQRLYQKAKQLIPGATGLLGKRSEMYLPDFWPAYYDRAKGCEIWDLDGNHYLDFTMVGIGTSVLGYADPDVEKAVIRAIKSGNMTTLNPPEEVELAELLCELHPWAERVKYARTGGEIMAMAVRIARAASAREKIAFCGYHGWHDWYLGVNLREDDALNEHLLPGLEPLGVPSGLRNTLLPFPYNDIEALRNLLRDNSGQIGAIVMEVVRSNGPQNEFLHEVRKLADEHNVILVFDEITSGWRMNTGGMHQIYGVNPDLAAFAKTISNGIPMAALIGKKEIMDYAQRTFISSAYWTERSGPSAALATLRKHRELDVGGYISSVGQRIQEFWRKTSEAEGLNIEVSGIPPLATFSICHPDSQALLTYHIQNMLDDGFLASHQFYPTLAHEEQHIAAYFEAFSESFAKVASAAREGDVKARLRGPIKHAGFKRLT